MKPVSVSGMQRLDLRTIEEEGIPGAVLMDRAGYGVANVVRHLQRTAGCQKKVHLIAGKGNNGGDVFVAARYLYEDRFDVIVSLTGKRAELKGDAREHYNRMTESGLICHERLNPTDWDSLSPLDEKSTIVVDGLLGTGTSGAPRGAVGSAINYINRISDQVFIVSIDIPSGVDGDTGNTPGNAVRADITVSMALPKKAFLHKNAQALLGSLKVIDIGVPDHYVEEEQSRIPEEMNIICLEDVCKLFRPRSFDSHKGRFGHTLLIGGAPGYSGAITMAGLAALRSGCGLVSIQTQPDIVDRVAQALPEAMVKENSSLNIEPFSSILLGPGMTVTDDTRNKVETIIQQATCPVVLDADALNVFEGQIDQLKNTQAPLILTPHPGEMARLLGVSTKEVQKNRNEAVHEAASRSGAVVVLKGAATLIASNVFGISLNLTGNPGMATGGSGDVLAGLLAGMLAQSKPLYQTVCTAVYLHGKAGDLASWSNTQSAMSATDIVHALPQAWQTILLR